MSAKNNCEKTAFDDLPLFDADRTYRLGIMGGTFNPIHYGHLVCAEQVRCDLQLDHVVFMPAGNPAYKQTTPIAHGDDRYAMTLLATSDNPWFSASRFELFDDGVTYTYHTLSRLRAFYPENVELYFITGADAIVNIARWKNAETIASLAHLVAVTRPGYNLDNAVDAIYDSAISFDVVYLEVPALAISSSSIRKRIQEGQSIRYLTPVSVEGYIAKKHLYVDGYELEDSIDVEL